MSSERINIAEENGNTYSLLQAILSNLDSIVIVVNNNNQIIYCNNSALNILGIKTQEEIHNQDNLITPYIKLFQSKKELKLNNQNYYLYASEKTLFKQALEKQNASGFSKISLNSASALDLIDEHKRYFALFQNSPFGLLFFDENTIVIDCNNAFLDIFKLNKDQCIGINLFERLKDKKLIEALKDMYDIGFAQYEDLYSSILDIKQLPIKIVLKRVIGDRGPIGGLAIIINMTEKFKHTKILQHSENKYKTIFDSINDAILINDIKTGSVIECNDKACEMFQYSKEEMLTKTVEQLSENISPFTLVEASKLIKQAISSGPKVFKWRAKKKDFSLFWVEVNIRIVSIGNIKFIIIVVRDITEQIAQTELQNNLYKELENKAEQLTKLNKELKNTESKLLTISENKDKFYSTISHDLKSPFLSILGYTEFLDRNLEKLSSSETKDSLNSLNLAISNVYSLIERLLEWSRTQSGEFYFQPQHLKLAELFDNNIDILIKNANYKNIRIFNKIENYITVTADEYMLNSVIRNLIGNAIKFSYVNSEIIISSKRSGAYECIMIKDFGTGIDPNLVPKLFSQKEHVTTKGTYRETGTGLGLLLCQEWIKKNNGKLWLNSEINKGTTIYFTLPVSKTGYE